MFFFKEYEYSTNTDCFVVDLTCLHLTFVTICFLTAVCLQSIVKTTTKSTNQSSWQDSGQILNHQYGISVTDRGTVVPPGKTTPAARSKERQLFLYMQAIIS